MRCHRLTCLASLLSILLLVFFFFFSSRRRHTRFDCDWSSDVCSSDLGGSPVEPGGYRGVEGGEIDATVEARGLPVAVRHGGDGVGVDVAERVDAPTKIGRASCRGRG